MVKHGVAYNARAVAFAIAFGLALVAAFVCVGPGATEVRAQDDAAEEPAPDPRIGDTEQDRSLASILRGKRITFALEKRSLHEVVTVIERVAGLRLPLEVDEEVDRARLVTLKGELSLWQALEMVGAQLDAQLHVFYGTVYFVPTEEEAPAPEDEADEETEADEASTSGSGGAAQPEAEEGESSVVEEEPLRPDQEIEQRIAWLELDEAKRLLKDYKRACKTDEEREILKRLTREVTTAKKVEGLVRKLRKHMAAGRYVDAYALGRGQRGRYRYALAVRALDDAITEARDRAYLVLVDFDDKKASPKVERVASEIAYGADPERGGRTLRWTCLEGPKKSSVQMSLSAPVDVRRFEAVIVRVRAQAVLTAGFYVRVFNADPSARAVYAFPKVRADGRWHELIAPVNRLDRKGAFNPAQVTAIGLYYHGDEQAVFEVDDLFLVRRP